MFQVLNVWLPIAIIEGIFISTTRTVDEEIHLWWENFEGVLNHEEPLNPPEVEPDDELNIGTCCISRAEIKKAIKKLKNRKAPG